MAFNLARTKKDFYWNDSPDIIKYQLLALLLLSVFIGWILNTSPQEAFRATIILSMLLISLIMYTAKYVKESFPIRGLGENYAHLNLALIAGAIAGIVLVFGVSNFHLATIKVASTLPGGLAYVYANIIMPITEEFLFRGVLVFLVAGLTSSLLYGLLTGNIFFSGYHYFVYNADPSQLLIAFAFGIVLSGLAIAFKSLGAAISGHLVFNVGATILGT